ncbi:KAT8 regulatory NSL complex subunit 2 [Trichoplax sp. H2]|nr:KAT8 regulatory NSL complex subunit 2 [Trichoplax sp. H2]|eukprot:RDD39938.1 KAT8 regulatory NSL complex subunit 2 [Trichoplax sp. H2]
MTETKKSKTVCHLSSKTGKLCRYPHRQCLRKPITGYSYCVRHILRDKNSPYVQCSYVGKVGKNSGKQCFFAALKNPQHKSQLCKFHHQQQQRKQTKKLPCKGKKKKIAIGEMILNHLQSCYDPTTSTNANNKSNKKRNKNPTPLTPSNKRNDSQSQFSDDEIVINNDNEASSTFAKLPVEDVWRGDADSEAESDGMDEDFQLLKNANVYTEKEACKIYCQKLSKLKELYNDQLDWMQSLLRKKRKQYLASVKGVEDLTGVKSEGETIRSYATAAYRRYQTKFGKEALLLKHTKEKDGKVTSYKGLTQRCIYNKNGVKCSRRCLPLTKYCSRHICFDSEQVLFRKCSFIGSNQHSCSYSVSLISDISTCPLHTQPKIEDKGNQSVDGDVTSTNNTLGNNINTVHSISNVNNDNEQDEIVVDDI